MLQMLLQQHYTKVKLSQLLEKILELHMHRVRVCVCVCSSIHYLLPVRTKFFKLDNTIDKWTDGEKERERVCVCVSKHSLPSSCQVRISQTWRHHRSVNRWCSPSLVPHCFLDGTVLMQGNLVLPSFHAYCYNTVTQKASRNQASKNGSNKCKMHTKHDIKKKGFQGELQKPWPWCLFGERWWRRAAQLGRRKSSRPTS